MLFRRIKAHIENENWFAVFIDFLIVVVGVFIGIQVANWNQTRTDHQTEATYLELLRGDLSSTIVNAKLQIEYEQFQSALANDAYLFIVESPSETRPQKLAIALSQLSGRRTLKVDSPTFLDMQSSGKLELISDTQLRSDIVTYFNRIERWVAIIQKNNDFFVDQGFNKFLNELAIGFWLWDEDLMQKKIYGSNLGEYENLMSERIIAPLLQVGGSALMSPPDAEIWERVAANLSTRASSSVANENYAMSLLQATSELEDKIKAHLEGER